MFVLLLSMDIAEAATTAQAPASAGTVAVPTAAEPATETLVLQLVINGEEMADFIEGAQRQGNAYLSLGQLAALLDFPIAVDGNSRMASGWFIHERNTIALSGETAEIRGRPTDIPAGGVFVIGQDLFVDLKLLQEWFPLSFSIEPRSMMLNITSREKLPFQEAAWRKKLHEALQRLKKPEQEENAKFLDQAYEAFQWPSFDLTFSPSYQSSTRESRADYSLQAAGDLGYLTSRLYAAGNLNDESLSDMRLSFGREDYEHRLLGRAKASSYSFGDINSIGLSQVMSPSQGRGFTVTNRALDRPDQFDVTNFIGDSKPGWEVELYRNGILINFQTVGTDGRYAFQDVPILFGTNVFRLAFYGPQGQRDEIIKEFNADSSLLNKGEFTYNLSIDQKEESLFGIANATSPGTGTNRMAGELEYGVSRWLTAVLGAAHTAISDGTENNYVAAGLHTAFGKVLAAFDGAYDAMNSGYSGRLSLSTSFLGMNAQLQQKTANNFESETDDATIRSQTDLTLSRSFDFPVLGMLNNNLSITRIAYTTNRRQDLVRYQFSKAFMGMSLSNDLNYDRDNLGLARLNGNLTLHGRYGDAQIDAQMDYTFRPDRHVDRTRFSLLTPITPAISNLATLTRQFAGSATTELQDTVTFDREKYKLSLTGRVDTKREFFLGMTVSTALGKIPGTDKWIASSIPLAQTGTVAVYPFLDRNYNQQLDQGEEAVPHLAIKVGNQLPKMNDAGFMMATQLPASLPVTVGMDQKAQYDPFTQDKEFNPRLVSSTFRVVPRPGKVVRVNFPLFETSQVDGIITVPEGVSPAALPVSLISTEGQQVVSSTRTAFDGYYLMEGVMPGAYRVRVPDDVLAKLQLKQAEERVLVIQESDIYAHDLALVKDETLQPKAPAAPPPRKKK